MMHVQPIRLQAALRNFLEKLYECPKPRFAVALFFYIGEDKAV
jgi:hypothetical protein